MAGGDGKPKFHFTREWQGLDVVGLAKKFLYRVTVAKK
jgi:hypothetical protein